MERYPLKLTFHVRQYAFGERLIPEKLGKEGTPDGIVAETWEISDYRDAPGTVANGPYAGRTLPDLVEEFPDELVGEGWRGPHFPILLKFLDASHMLPVHLHPDDETARRKHGEPHGKSEAWHILWAEPDASILAGIKEGFSRDDLFDAFKRQDYDAVMPRYPIRAGDTVYVPGGILHTFGPGTLIAEFQQTSEPVFTGRVPKALWVEAARVAEDGLRAAEQGRRTVIPGGPLVWAAFAPNRAMPSAVTLPVTRSMMSGELSRGGSR